MDLKNKKVYVDGRSAEIQKKAFELGFRVVDDDLIDGHPFIYFPINQCLSYGNDMEEFVNSGFEEVTADEIIAIKVEPKFKPFDRVLVRDRIAEKWKASIFSHANKDEKYPFKTIGSGYVYCIPYEGNEHLVGTSNDPE